MPERTVTERVLDEIAKAPGCRLDEILMACPDLTWNQVFQAVDRLSRTGHLRLHHEGPGLYTVQLGPHAHTLHASGGLP